MKKCFALSPEGIPWKEYKIFQFILAAPLSYPIGFGLEIMWKLSKTQARQKGIELVPNNAILYGFHVDVCFNYITMHLLREANKKAMYIVSHDFASYLAAGPGSFGAYDPWRFDRRLPSRPSKQIVKMLKSNPNRILGIFTDGGGSKCFRVRESLVKLAIDTQRPLVPYRSFYGPSFHFMGNRFPLIPWVKGESVFGKTIQWQELTKTNPEQARLQLEKAINLLKPSK